MEISAWIREADERALVSLTNIAVVYPPGKHTQWVLEFHFAKNNFFTNDVLRLGYVYKARNNARIRSIREGTDFR